MNLHDKVKFPTKVKIEPEEDIKPKIEKAREEKPEPPKSLLSLCAYSDSDSD